MDLKSKIWETPDFPQKGVIFRDISPLLADKDAFAYMVQTLAECLAPLELGYVAAIDARGFLVGAAVAYALRVGLIPIRKHGKLPGAVITAGYASEYDMGAFEMCGALGVEGKRVAIIDDVLATGGTIGAAVELIKKAGANPVALAFIIELTEFGAREKFEEEKVFSLVQY